VAAPPDATFPAVSYYRLSRTHRYSVLLALPLLVLYETLAAVLASAGGDVRNGADVLLKSPFVAMLGERGPVAFGACLVLGAVGIVWRDTRASGGPLRGRIFGLMLVESAALALAFGTVVGLVTAQLLGAFGSLHAVLPAGPPLAAGGVTSFGGMTQFMVSLGAGLYEELLFRVILVGAIAAFARRVLGWGPRGAGALAVITGALVFSAFHYVGPYGDRLELTSFAFRAVAGVFFSALYVTRGFGITAWTHALYDVFLLVL
jgi:hypothetical protein